MDTFLNYYDTNLEKTEVICDASPVGLGAMLVQYEKNNPKPRIVAYNSKALTEVETRYSQIEREALAIQFACIKFRMYLLGHPGFTVVTDHKPLVSIFNNPKKPGPFRVEKMRLKLQGYSFQVVYKKGDSNPTDYLSRHPQKLSECTKEDLEMSNELEAYVHWVTSSGLPNAVQVSDIQEAVAKDAVLQRVIKHFKHGTLKNINDSQLSPYKSVEGELSIVNGMLLKGKNIIVPKELQEKIVTISHEGHQGLVKSKMFLRSKMWFPGMDKMVEKEVKVCAPCQAAVETPCQEPMTSTELPNGPWEHIAIDFKGPLKTGEYAFVAIDEYSRYPEVEFVSNTSAKAAIPKLDKILSTFGIPLKIRSDNGSPFNSESFKDYAKYMGFEHIPITPVYPKANGLVENFMKNIVKVNRTAIVERKSLKQELYKFLRVYRATPHCSTQKTPAELMFQARPFRARLPEINTEVDDSAVRDNDKRKKLTQKMNADNKSYVKTSNIKVGDSVLLKQYKTSKMLPVYDPEPYIVVSRIGNEVKVKRNSQTVKRNVTFFKKFFTKDAESDDEIQEEVNKDDEENESGVMENVDLDDDFEEEEVNKDDKENEPKVLEKDGQGEEIVPPEEGMASPEKDEEMGSGRPRRNRKKPAYLSEHYVSY